MNKTYFRNSLIFRFINRNKLVFILSFTIVGLTFFGTIVILTFFYHDTQMTVINATEDIINTEGEERLIWIDIFVHNFIILLPTLIGVLSLGFISLLYVVLQGYLLGVTIYSALQNLPLSTVLKLTVFHGLFEMIAVCFVLSFAVKPGEIIIKGLLKRGKLIQKQDLLDMIIIFILYIFFLFIASIIEAVILKNV